MGGRFPLQDEAGEAMYFSGYSSPIDLLNILALSWIRLPRVPAATGQKTEMQTTERGFTPTHRLVEIFLHQIVKSRLETDIPTMEPFYHIPAPCCDGSEVVELRHTSARGRHEAGSRRVIRGDGSAVQHIPLHSPDVVKLTAKDL